MSLITKSARISKSGRPPEGDMDAINAQALEPLSPEEVFAFRVAMCDTRTDRDYERFSEAALEELAPMFVGRTVVKDHDHRSDNQVARVYEAHVERDADGESTLVGSAYMLDTPANAALIADIRGGIRREVSVGVAVRSAVCSVCGRDNAKRACEHWPGRAYDGRTCTFELSGAADAYELSFVAVPAQRGAGVRKSYLPEGARPEPAGPDAEPETAAAPGPAGPGPDALREASLRARAVAAWALANGAD